MIFWPISLRQSMQAELMSLGKRRWDTEHPLRLAGEAVIGIPGWSENRPT
jgi:hypothetical protein